MFCLAPLLPLIALFVLSVESEVTDTKRKCIGRQSCLKVGDCPHYKNKYDQLSQLSREEKSAVVKELKSAVCNKDEGAFCCPCRFEEICVSSNKCTWYTNKLMEYKNNIKDSKSGTAADILKDLKSRICNKRKGFICCPKSVDPTSPTYLPDEENCGRNPDAPPSKVFGGHDTKPGDHPWAALLGQTRYRKKDGRETKEKYTRWSCGGILINRWYVLTAAHCQGSNKDGSRIDKVRLGEWKVAGIRADNRCHDACLPEEQDFDITWNDVYKHEEYGVVKTNGKKNLINDIALIRLPKMVSLNGGVHIVCLPIRTYIDNDIDKSQATVVGWGYKDGYDPFSFKEQGDQKFFGVASKIQQYAKLPILSVADCTRNNPNLSPTKSQICAGGERGVDSCKGDSGSGLYLSNYTLDTSPWYLVGIVSFGSSVCGIGTPGMYTRVSYYIQWIRQNIE